jgi:4-diphosphocytidyl-2-C-methyl-D-erythritol kinase
MRSSGTQREFAPAKINLFLHVGPIGADGYHPICSLMAFTDVGDELRLDPADRMEFRLDGPFGGGLDPDDGNLAIRARDALLAAAGRQPDPFRLTLDKRLPIAAGLGGGSADAAAAMRLIRRAADLDLSDKALGEIARSLGSDVPACLRGRLTIAAGRGDRLSPAPDLPDLHLTLVNPGVLSPTAGVYRAYDREPDVADAPVLPKTIATAAEAAAFLRGCRNDLEGPAVRLQPRIGDALAALAAQAEALLARMSGSGATCFALCANGGEAMALTAKMARLHPEWWVRQALIKNSTTW